MLKTNNVNEYGIVVVKPWTGSAYNEIALCYSREFVVKPSPCANNGDHRIANPYTFTVTERWEPNGTAYNWDNWGSGYLMSRTGYLGGSFGPTPSIVMDDNSTSIQNRALAKLYDQIRDSEVSLNTTIGEGRETLDMFMAVARGAQQFVTNFRQAKKKLKREVLSAIRNPLQTVGGLELLWSVGLSPLINDVENLRNHVANKKELHIDIPAQSRASKTHEKSNVTYPSGATQVEERELSQRIEYSLVFRVDDLHTFENWRLGLTVRPTLLWELTTLSFVVDYFINIGQYLELLEASILNNGFSFVSGYVTTTSKDSWWIRSEKPLWKNPNARSDGHSWSCRGGVRTKTRSRLTSFPAPMRPTVKLPSAASQLLNCAALLSQLITRR